MTPRVRVQLLGEFRLWLDDTPCFDVDKPRQQELLAYLLLHRHAPQLRTQIAFRLWPDSSEAQALTNLRKLYFQLRHALPHAESLLVADATHFALNRSAEYTLDVADLEARLAEIESAAEPEVNLFHALAAAYQGELLPACYEEWLLSLRYTLHDRVVRALLRGLSVAELRHDYRGGQQISQDLLRLEPLHEVTYRHLMQFHALAGDRASALKVYYDCVQILEQELGVAPSTETQALYDSILHGESEASTREQAPQDQPSLTADTLLPLVGRRAELQTLRGVWQRALGSGPQLVLLSGEAGIGKTRLVEEFVRWARMRQATVVSGRAYAAEGALAYAPLAEWLRDASLRPRLAQLEPLWRTEIARLLPELLAEDAALPHPAPMTESWQRQRFHEALARAILLAPAPYLLVIEDLQWCDGETLSWLPYLMRYSPNAAVLVVVTARSEEVAHDHPLHHLRQPLVRAAQWEEVHLGQLDEAETAQLAAHLSQRDLSHWTETLHRESEGNPLFIVELMRAGFLDAAHSGERFAIPRSMQAITEERLRQLSPQVRQLVSLAATIGRAFSVEELAAIVAMPDDEFVRALDELWRKRILRAQGARYDFGHDRIREIVYRQSGGETRRTLHRTVVEALSRVHAEQLDEVAGELAVHAEAAGDSVRALTYLEHAARAAQSMAANQEVVAYVRKALSLLPLSNLPQSQAMQVELELLVQLGSNLLALRGYGNPEVQEVYARAYELLRQTPTDAAHMPILVGLGLYYMVSGQLQRALLIGEQGLSLAQRIGDDGLLVEAHVFLGSVVEYLGDFARSVVHFEETIRLYNPHLHGDHAIRYGQDPLVAARVMLATSLAHLGDDEGAAHQVEEAVLAARTLSHHYTHTMALTFGGHLYHLLRRPQIGARYSQMGLEMAQRYGYIYWVVTGSMILGWAQTQLLLAQTQAVAAREDTTGFTPEVAGKMSAEIEGIRAAYEGFKMTGAGLFRSYYLGLIAEAELAAGNIDAALTAIEAACEVADSGEDKFWSAEVHRLHGEIMLLRSAAPEAAAAAFDRALAIAEQQGSRAIAARIRDSMQRPPPNA